MVREPIYAAMDIGTSKVVAIVARLGPEGELRLMGTGEAPAQGVEHGVIEDAEAAREAVRESLGECLRYMGRNPVHGLLRGGERGTIWWGATRGRCWAAATGC